MPKPSDINYDQINPGIRKLVKFLRDNGFNTCDSGDGITRDYECDPGFPYVTIRVYKDSLISESERLMELLENLGVKFEPQNAECDAITIEATYSPTWKDIHDQAFIHLFYVVDKDVWSC